MNNVLPNKKMLGLLLGPLAFLLIMVLVDPESMGGPAKAVLASTLWVAIWWISEAVPIPVTSLLPIILLPLSGGLGAAATTAAYGDRMIFLFLGGFIIATALEKWNLHKRVALRIILMVGTNPRSIILGFMVATAFLSMWISNTATAMMMMPIGLAVVYQLSNFFKQSGRGEKDDRHFGMALMLGIAYSASIGGIATLVGTPTNAVFVAIVDQLFDFEISFAGWMFLAFPLVVVLLFLCWLYLIYIAFPLKSLQAASTSVEIQESPGSATAPFTQTGILAFSASGGKEPSLKEGLSEEIKNEYLQLGSMKVEEKWVMAVFSLTALAWITRTYLLNLFLPALDDTIIAIAGAVVLFLIPSSRKGEAILDWKTAVKIPWGILLLFGGGLAIAEGFKTSGLAGWIGAQLSVLDGVSFILMLAMIVLFVNFLTEVTSNTATATMILPVMASLALAIDVHPFALMVGACLSASCAFMLPVATPPNAVVFGSGYIRMQDMVKAGVWLNLLSVALIVLYIWFFMPLLWKLELQHFPAIFK